MSTLRDQIKSKSAGLVRRETVRLPECGLEVQVRGLMAGEVQRCGQSKRSGEVQVALSTEDPATGKFIWNPNTLQDLDEIATLHPVDYTTLIEASNRLSGLEKLGKLFSPSPTNGSSPSQPDSAEPSGS